MPTQYETRRNNRYVFKTLLQAFDSGNKIFFFFFLGSLSCLRNCQPLASGSSAAESLDGYYPARISYLSNLT